MKPPECRAKIEKIKSQEENGRGDRIPDLFSQNQRYQSKNTENQSLLSPSKVVHLLIDTIQCTITAQMWHSFQKSLDVAFYRCERYRIFAPSKAKLWRMVLMGIMPPAYQQHASVLAGAGPIRGFASSAICSTDMLLDDRYKSTLDRDTGQVGEGNRCAEPQARLCPRLHSICRPFAACD